MRRIYGMPVRPAVSRTMLTATLLVSVACSARGTARMGAPPGPVAAVASVTAVAEVTPSAGTPLLLTTPGGALPAAPLPAVAPPDTSAPTAVPAVAAASDSAPPGAEWDIEAKAYESNPRVQHFVEIFTHRARAAFELSLQRQTRYGPFIRQRLRAGGLPEDLIFLALIESWYDPHAYSKAAAVGLWQFMAGTARGVGLRVDWWVDERRDPAHATEGAVRLLSGLRGQFGSMYLAAAAYDGGDGRVSRGLARNARRMQGVEGEDRFFALADTKYLRAETRDYVPKLIAAALVGKEPGRYGLAVDSVAPWAFDSVRAAGGTPLAAVAAAARAELAQIMELNPHLLRGLTPPGDSAWVRVDVGGADGFGDRLLALDSASRLGLTRVVSRAGETMASIAKKNGLTAKQLNWYNPKVVRLKSGALRAGQTILVPSKSVVSAARDVPNPSIERYPRRRAKAPTPVRAAKPGVR